MNPQKINHTPTESIKLAQIVELLLTESKSVEQVNRELQSFCSLDMSTVRE